MFEQVSDPAGRHWKLWLVLAALAFTLLASLIWVLRMTRMPLKSYAGQLPPLTGEQLETANHLSQHVKYLSATIGERNLSRSGTLRAATDYVQNQLKLAGYSVREQTYRVQGNHVRNLEVMLHGSDVTAKTVVVGAHYDTVAGSPGANDNASGVAAVLELARIWQNDSLGTLRERGATVLSNSRHGKFGLRPSASERACFCLRNDFVGDYWFLFRCSRQPEISGPVGAVLSRPWQLHWFCRESRVAKSGTAVHP